MGIFYFWGKIQKRYNLPFAPFFGGSGAEAPFTLLRCHQPHPSARRPTLPSPLRTEEFPAPCSSSPWWGLHAPSLGICFTEVKSHMIYFVTGFLRFLIRVIMKHHVFEVHACCSTRQNSLPFKGWMTPCACTDHRPWTHPGVKDTWGVSIFWLLWITLLCEIQFYFLFWTSNTQIWYKMQKGPQEETLKVYLPPTWSALQPLSTEELLSTVLSVKFMLKNFWKFYLCYKNYIYICVCVYFPTFHLKFQSPERYNSNILLIILSCFFLCPWARTHSHLRFYCSHLSFKNTVFSPWVPQHPHQGNEC